MSQHAIEQEKTPVISTSTDVHVTSDSTLSVASQASSAVPIPGTSRPTTSSSGAPSSGPDGPGLASLSALPAEWTTDWGGAIDSYLVAETKTHKDLIKNHPALAGLLRDLADSLKALDQPSSAARAILDTIMRTVVNTKPKVEKQIAALEASTKPGDAEKARTIRASMPTAFPTFSSNVWLEYINAKALWIRNQDEDRELLPGEKPEGNGEGKPDYRTKPVDTGDGEPRQVMGDHIGVKVGDTPETVAKQVASSILTKVSKYDTALMRVVVDVTRAPAKQALWDTADHGKAEIITLLNKDLSADTKFWSASIVFDDALILDIKRADCRPTKPATPTKTQTTQTGGSV